MSSPSSSPLRNDAQAFITSNLHALYVQYNTFADNWAPTTQDLLKSFSTYGHKNITWLKNYSVDDIDANFKFLSKGCLVFFAYEQCKSFLFYKFALKPFALGTLSLILLDIINRKVEAKQPTTDKSSHQSGPDASQEKPKETENSSTNTNGVYPSINDSNKIVTDNTTTATNNNTNTTVTL